ncbi:MAG: ABC transporter permease [Phycisphaerales bacterium]
MRLQILTIARNTFVESIRQPVVFALVMACGLLVLLSTWSTGFAMGYTDTSEVSGDDKLLLDIGLATVFVCGMLLSAFIATAAVSREIENKTVLTVVSKPVSRPAVVVGKYLGVAGAIVLALVPMLLFLLIGIRHGVMSTAADDLDQPVFLFLGLAVGGALLIAAWTNFFYGSYFSQTFLVVLAPALLVAYLLLLVIGKKWHLQPPMAGFKPQITIACGALTMAVLVLTAVAVAVSTRLGQVMTIVVCAGVFVFGLLSNHFLGRHAFENRPLGIVLGVTLKETLDSDLSPGQTLTVTLRNEPKQTVRPGDPFYWGPSPSGYPMSVSAYPRFTGDAASSADALGSGTPPGMVITSARGRTLEVRRVGTGELRASRGPAAGDYMFVEPTRINPLALAAWAVVPNMHYFWLVDAITQNQYIPPGHMGLVAAYALAQIIGFVCLGVVLFQTRDVG